MDGSTPRSLRRKRFEQQMCDVGMAHEDRVLARQQWLKVESDHMRQMRVLKASSIQRHHLKGINIAGYDTIRVLGKGSFGVVRLVSEASPKTVGPCESTGNQRDGECTPLETSAANLAVNGTARRNLPPGKPLSDVYAMKVIRKSEMLRACQEGHLRAERDFLVASEGSRWAVGAPLGDCTRKVTADNHISISKGPAYCKLPGQHQSLPRHGIHDWRRLPGLAAA